ncbi:hypothetical protein [Methanobacterium sp.]|uniref:hypothetical protein n=1 Tax=Methanobacterium sp. TaxID=2164 RepID=UPI0025DCC614|nr:hypothetical protein [Methanobacterium sp.]
MTRSRRYLNNLPNVENIKDLARDILDCELKLDRAIQDNAKVKDDILVLETQLLSFDNEENPQKIKNTQVKLEKLPHVLFSNDKKIAGLKKKDFFFQIPG